MHLCHPLLVNPSERDSSPLWTRDLEGRIHGISGVENGESAPRTCLPADSAGQNLPLLGDALQEVALKLHEIAGKNRFSKVRHGNCSSYSSKTPTVGVPGERPGHWKD